MYEYDDQQAKDEAQQSKAAVVIQSRWREFHSRREAQLELESRRGRPVSVAAAAAAAAVTGVNAGASGASPSASTGREPASLLVEYARLLERRRTVVEQSLTYQRQLARHFAAQRQRKGEERAAVAPEAELQYWAAVRQMREERRVAQDRKEELGQLLAEIQALHQATIDEALAREEDFRAYIRQLALESVFVRTHQRLPEEEIDAFLRREAEQRREIRNARIRQILLCRELEKLQRTSTQRDQQQDGMNLIDFEQLKIENTNLNEKIEERNEDLVKLRRKVTTTIHVLTHVKEKLEFMKIENTQLRRQVSSTEDELNELRDKLAQTKRRRDHFTTLNIKMREKMPMVGSEKLLLDFEKRKAASNTMRQSVLDNAAKHKELLAAIDRNQVVLYNLQKSLALGNQANVASEALKTLTE